MGKRKKPKPQIAAFEVIETHPSEPAIVHMEIQEANWPPQTLDPSQEEIQELEKILSEARNPSSPLHKHFQWDDAKAAQAWREQQAEGLWNSFDVVPVKKQKRHK